MANRLLLTPGFSSEAEASATLTASAQQVHLAIDRMMNDVTSLCVDAIKRRTKLLHDQTNEALCKELAHVGELKAWLERRDKTSDEKDFVLLEKTVPCHPLSLDDSNMSSQSQKLVNLLMEVGRVQVGSPTLDDSSFSDCISLGLTSTDSSNVNYSEKQKPRKTFGLKNTSGPESDKFNSPRGVCLLAGGLVAVADGYNDRVKLIDIVSMQQHSQTLSFNIDRAKTIASKQLTFTGLAADRTRGRLLVADAERGSVFAVDSARIGASTGSNQLSDWPIVASLGTHGFQPKQFNVPIGICTDPHGEHLFVCDSKNHQVKIWSLKTNEFVQTLGDYGKKIGQFIEPSYCGVTELDSASLLLAVSDSGNARIQLFKVEAMNLQILPLRALGREGSSLGQLSNPRGVWFDAAGNLLVADAGNKRLQVFGKDGSPITAFATGIGLIPEGLVVLEENGLVLVTDRKQHQVHIF